VIEKDCQMAKKKSRTLHKKFSDLGRRPGEIYLSQEKVDTVLQTEKCGPKNGPGVVGPARPCTRDQWGRGRWRGQNRPSRRKGQRQSDTRRRRKWKKENISESQEGSRSCRPKTEKRKKRVRGVRSDRWGDSGAPIPGRGKSLGARPKKGQNEGGGGGLKHPKAQGTTSRSHLTLLGVSPTLDGEAPDWKKTGSYELHAAGQKLHEIALRSKQPAL